MIIMTIIAYKTIQRSARESTKKNYVYCDYNDTSMTCINSNMALMRVRNN